jgi:murein DD-endopeptidase MepM/ murein hydrolase activator NlpD
MADDYAGSTSTTGTVSVGGSRSANIETSGDTDWFRITLQAGFTYRFDMLGSPTGDGSLSDAFMRIRDSSGNSLDDDDDGGTGLNATITGFVATYSGTYYLSAGSGATPGGIGTYVLTATQTGSPTITDDYAGNTGTTGTLSVGGSRSANIETSGDTDWFRITLQAGHTYQFDTLGSPSGNGSLSDAFMRIRDSSGDSLDDDDDGGTGLNARITGFVASYSGTYYISAGSGATPGGTGTYVVTASDTTPATTPEVTVLGNGTSIIDGDTTPSATDSTDLGSAVLGSAGVTQTFTVRNDGDATLTLGSLVLPTGFTLVNGLVASLAAGASDTFQVRMNATTVGTHSGQISFTSNDTNESPFNFSITGTVTSTPTPTPVWTKPVAFANPIAGPLVVTQGYGGDTSHGAGNGSLGTDRIKYAIDISAAVSTNVDSIGTGTVVSIRNNSTGQGDTSVGGLGNFVTVLYAGGVYATFAHLSVVSIAVGASVSVGTDLGKTGMTGTSFGPHLHLHFGTTTYAPSLGGPFYADGSTRLVTPAFIASFVTSNEVPGFTNILSSILSTDVFGTSDATNASSSTTSPRGVLSADEDELDGNASGNRIFGLSGGDWIYGNGGADILVGGTGNDRLRGDTNGGAAFADSFVFAPGHGRDRIVDFQDGVDSIRILGFSGGFNALTIEALSTGTRIHYGADWIDLVGVNSSVIGASDFVFV